MKDIGKGANSHLQFKVAMTTGHRRAALGLTGGDARPSTNTGHLPHTTLAVSCFIFSA
jgi:hypothetical protein